MVLAMDSLNVFLSMQQAFGWVEKLRPIILTAYYKKIKSEYA